MEYKGCQINAVTDYKGKTMYQTVNSKGYGIAYAKTESAAKAVITKYLKQAEIYSYEWICPKCGYEQTQTVHPVDGPFEWCICEDCTNEFRKDEVTIKQYD